VVIVGAGPCGLACARELLTAADDNGSDVRVFEASAVPGGLASSITDPQGFTWDRGGHVVFSHYGEFDQLLADVMGEDVERHERSSYIRIADRWVPYPFQHNLHRLPEPLAVRALVGLVEAQTSGAAAPASDIGGELDFGTWIDSMFGEGVAELFMRPYNEKVWAHPVSSMGSQWMAERVATVDWRRALRSAVARDDDEGWGPNNLFAFPSSGGTGEIYRRLADRMADHIRYDSDVTAVDPTDRTITISSRVPGEVEVVPFDHLVWTGPLDLLVHRLVGAPPEVRTAADDLVHNSVTVVGVGYETPLTDDRSWLYFPEPEVPFYRATNFAKYARANVPGGRTDRYSSWMTEIGSSAWRPLPGDDEELVGMVDGALRRVGLVPEGAPVATTHVDHIPYAYPVPTLRRDAALATIQPWLAQRSILGRGRFGAWKYELGNMDHAVKMGIDAARRIRLGEPEEAWS